ncbi:MAG: hypothetical protein WA553_13065 [Methylocella sp.]
MSAARMHCAACPWPATLHVLRNLVAELHARDSRRLRPRLEADFLLADISGVARRVRMASAASYGANGLDFIAANAAATPRSRGLRVGPRPYIT